MLDNHSQIEFEVRVVIFSLQNNRLQILLEPLTGSRWQLPGRPVAGGYSLEFVAASCLHETIGCGEVYLEQLYTYGDPVRSSISHMITIAYFALIPMDACRGTTPNQKVISWRPLDELPELIMDHSEIVHYAFRRLRYKLEYSAVGFELLPENFSLSELQHTYEMILGEELDKRNFRRRILEAGIIEPTPHRRVGEGRPAQLYHYRPDAVAEIKVRRLFP